MKFIRKLGNLNKRMLAFIFSIFWLFMWFMDIFILLNFAMRWWPGDSLRTVRFINYFMPWLLMPLVPCCLLAGLASRPWLFITLLATSIIICLNYFPLFFNCTKKALVDDVIVKVMSYNVWTKNRSLSDAVKLIVKENPDILLLQEVNSIEFQDFADNLIGQLPGVQYYVEHVPDINQAIISCYPIEPLGVSEEKCRSQKVQLYTPYGRIVVINIHAYNFPWMRRHRQLLALIKEDIVNSDHPIILGGDFNTTENSQSCRILKRYLKSAYYESGCGFGFTFPTPKKWIAGCYSLPALIRIDHVFYSNHFIPIYARTLNESGGSDHFPLVIEFGIKSNLLTIKN